MPDFLFYGDTERSHAMRHELPLAIGDPFTMAIVDGQLHIEVNSLERDRVEATAPHAVLHDINDLGFSELRQSGMRFHEIMAELASRMVSGIGIREAIADPEMPVAIADRLRADGVVLHLDHAAVTARRRVKTPEELAGIRRAQAAAEAGMSAAAEMLRRAVPEGDGVTLEGEALTAETLRAAVREACARMGAPAPPDIIVSSAWQGYGHDPGTGPLPANLPISIDLWPRDESSGCWADMTRTLVVGEVTAAVADRAELVRTALEQARAAVRPGITGRELHAMVCDLFEEAGYRTQRTASDGDSNDGFQFALGHGVGLAVHESPSLGQTGHDPLVAGDVIAMEPGLWTRDMGDVRFEDLLLVTDDGSETLTRYPYELVP